MLSNILDYSNSNGLVFCDKIEEAKNYSEILYIDEARKLGVSSVLFRRFYKDNSLDSHQQKPYQSEPSVCIFQKEESFFHSPEHLELHSKIWSAGKNEIYIILSSTRIDIINARKPATLINNNKLSLHELIMLSSKFSDGFYDKRFSAYLFGSGTFWDQGDFYDVTKDKLFFKNKLEEENMPYHQLLFFLKQTRKLLRKTNLVELESEIVDKLLVICILIKFLEEIKSSDGAHTLTQIYQNYNIATFFDALMRKGCAVKILEDLGKELNGRIFDYFTTQKDEESLEEFNSRNNLIKSKLRDADLSPIARLLYIKIDNTTGELEFDPFTDQLKLNFNFSWQQYSFRHLPIELISSIYEHFLQEDAKEMDGEIEKGVVYTPPFLVNFLVDEMMPLEKPYLLNNKEFKVIDPCCGSGIFLVAAYKRMLQWWIIQYFEKYHKLPSKFDPKDFQEILENNIYGLDVNKKATLISIFSLTITFLDRLDPIAFWENLNFKKLQDNIKSINFFQWASTNPPKFDLIIGNPPFNVPTIFKRRINEYIEKNIIPYSSRNINKQIPDKSLALYFLEFAIQMSKGKICLILPVSIFLYSNKGSHVKYRQELFTRLNVRKIFDFTHLRRVLFKRLGNKNKFNNREKDFSEPSVCALVVENKISEKQNLDHVILKRLNLSDNKIRFEIDYYDHHFIPWSWAIDEKKQFLWKANLLGGGRLFHLISRLSLQQNLTQFINKKKKENSEWIFQKGYLLGSPPKNAKVISYLYNQDRAGIQEGELIKVGVEKNKYFERPRPRKLYKLPLLLIHLKIGKARLHLGIKEKYSRSYFVFDSSKVGIHAPMIELETLKQIHSRLLRYNDTYLLWILVKSSSALVYQETKLTKTEIDTLPFPQLGNDEQLVLSDTEKLIQEDVIKYYIHSGKSISSYGAGSVLNQKVDEKRLKKFGQIFCESLNTIYAKSNTSWQIGKISCSSAIVILQFGFGKNEGLKYKYQIDLEPITDEIENFYKSNSEFMSLKIFRLYNHADGYDNIYLIKPNNLRYWLNSIALRDADDTFLDFKRGGF